MDEIKKELHRQGLLLELLIEILTTMTEEQGLSLISYQQLHCPSTERNEKVRMLLKEIREHEQSFS